MNRLITDNMNAITDVCRKHHVKELYVFGSVTDDQRFNSQSDIDLLVEFDNVPLEEYADNYTSFVDALQQTLGRSIDLVTAKYLRNRFFIQRVNETKQKLYAA